MSESSLADWNSYRGLAASIMRFTAFHRTNSFTDPTYNAVELIIWTLAEPGIYLIAACLMTYRPLLDKVSSKIKTNINSGQQSSDRNSPSHRAENGYSHGHRSAKASQMAGYSSDGYNINQDKAIMLSSISARGDGFEQLSDSESFSGQDHLRQAALPKAAILKTSDVHMAWERTAH